MPLLVACTDLWLGRRRQHAARRRGLEGDSGLYPDADGAPHTGFGGGGGSFGGAGSDGAWAGGGDGGGG